MLTLDDVKKRINEIKEMAYDNEVAHLKEDNMRWEVLAAIANGTCSDPIACAKEALKSSEIKFQRWYA